jgi:hypothetical protein
LVLVVDPEAQRDLRASLRIPAGDRPIGEEQLVAWWRERRARGVESRPRGVE